MGTPKWFSIKNNLTKRLKTLKNLTHTIGNLPVNTKYDGQWNDKHCCILPVLRLS